MARKTLRIVGASLVVAIVASAGFLAYTAWADPDCTICTECAADPVFIQRDQRNPELLAIVAKVGSRAVKKEGLKAVVLFSDGQGSEQKSSNIARTIVLIASQGNVERLQVNGEILAEIKTLVRYDADNQQEREAK